MPTVNGKPTLVGSPGAHWHRLRKQLKKDAEGFVRYKSEWFSYYIYTSCQKVIEAIQNDKFWQHVVTTVEYSSDRYLDGYANKEMGVYDVEYKTRYDKDYPFKIYLGTAWSRGKRHVDQIQRLLKTIESNTEEFAASERILDRLRMHYTYNCFFFSANLDAVLMARLIAPDLISKVVKLESKVADRIGTEAN